MNGVEYIDIYDENKNQKGYTLPRKGRKLEKGEFMLVVLALIERPDHTFLITQRTMDKKWAAGGWEVSGGGAMAGETSFEAVCREVKEEVGLDVSQAEGGLVYTYSNEDLERGDNYFTDIYHFCMDFTEEDVTIQESEAMGFRIVPFSEITRIREESQFLHYERILEAFQAEGYKI